MSSAVSRVGTGALSEDAVKAIENAASAWCEWCKNSVSHHEGCPDAPAREPDECEAETTTGE